METTGIVQALNQLQWFDLTFKALAVLFSVGYLGYAFIFQQQLVKMEKNALVYYFLLENPDYSDDPPHPTIFSFGLLQLFIGVSLLFISLFLL